MGGMFRKYPRASWHDYNCGLYFVTVCTSQHKYYFGQIRDGEIELSSLGKYLCGAIEQAGLHYPYITIDTYVVMPNHFHVIMIVLETGLDMPEKSVADVNTGCVAAPCSCPDLPFSLVHGTAFCLFICKQSGQDIVLFAAGANLSACNDNDVVRNFHDPFLVGDDQQ